MAFSLAKSGYRMPAEWEPHEATWIAWPHNKDDWPARFGPIPWVYAEIVRHLHHGERVRILVNGTRVEEEARKTLRESQIDLSRVDFYRFAKHRQNEFAIMRDAEMLEFRIGVRRVVVGIGRSRIVAGANAGSSQ